MTKLKTLKDLIGFSSGDDVVFPDILREEAIKWVKRYPDAYDRNRFICKFFNITEEDLK